MKGKEIDEVDQKIAAGLARELEEINEKELEQIQSIYLLVKECSRSGVRIISNAQLQQAKTAMRALDDKAKQAGFDTEAAWNRSVQAYESGHGQMFSLARMMGKTTGFNPEFQRGCHLALEGLKISAQGASGGRRKKDF